MNFKILFLTTVLFIAPALAAAHPIIIRHDREDAAYRDLGARYAGALCEVRVKDGQGVRVALGTLIGPRWVLTAAHVAQGMEPGHAIRFDGQDYPVARVTLQPKWQGQEHDLALIYLQTPVASAQPLPLYRWDDEAGQQIIFVGSGMAGNGQTGPTEEDGIIRGATNRVNEVGPEWLNFIFNAPDTPGVTDLEGISGPGDSGGPGILLREGTAYLAGISSGQDTEPTGGKEGRYGVIEYYTRISHYIDWIERTMQAMVEQNIYSGDSVETPRSTSRTAADLAETPEAHPTVSGLGLGDDCDAEWEGLPDSPVGQAAAALLTTLCKADEAVHRAFIETQLASSFRDQFPMKEHLRIFSRMHASLGRARVVKVVEARPHEAQVVVQSQADGQLFTIMLEVDTAPPHQIIGVGIEQGDVTK